MITRFAPSPTGPLHLGHAYSAILAHDMAQNAGGRFLLRIDDIDRARARAHWADQIADDLHWLGLTWPQPPLVQSTRLPAYEAALDRLWAAGLLYPCHCSRRDIANAAEAPQEGVPTHGPDGLIYPGTCAPPPDHPPPQTPRPAGVALRLSMRRAMDLAGPDLSFTETGHGPGGETGIIRLSPAQMIDTIGDVVLSRPAMAGSYHLSVTLDDAFQKITHVTRGRDLFAATAIHRLLQALLDLPTPVYHHHRLIRDEAGKRLAKRDDARALARYRQDGATAKDIRRMLGL